MNIATFGDVAKSKRDSLAHDLDDEDDEEDREIVQHKGRIEGEEEDGDEKFNEAGIAIEPFNMKSDRDGGGFVDENMNFVFTKDKVDVDAWVAGMNDEESMEQVIGEAAIAKKKKDQARALQEEKDAEADLTRKTPLELKKEILALMKPGETIPRAMKRLKDQAASGSASTENIGAAGVARRRPPPPLSAAAVVATAPAAAASVALLSTDAEKDKKERAVIVKKQIDRITEIADELMSTGLSNVYHMSFESLRASTVKWQYQALDGSTTLHGPFTAVEIAKWKSSGYLTGQYAVMMCPVPIVCAYGSSSSSGTSGGGGGGGIYDDGEDNDVVVATTTPSIFPAHVTVPDTWISSDSIDFSGYLNVVENEALDNATLSLHGGERKDGANIKRSRDGISRVGGESGSGNSSSSSSSNKHGRGVRFASTGTNVNETPTNAGGEEKSSDIEGGAPWARAAALAEQSADLYGNSDDDDGGDDDDHHDDAADDDDLSRMSSKRKKSGRFNTEADEYEDE